GLSVPMLAGVACVLTCASFSRLVFGGVPWVSLDLVLMVAFAALAIGVLMTWTEEADALSLVAASVLPLVYLGLPVGAMIAVRETHGREALALLMLTIIVSDTAQFYTGRTIGRRLLAPTISPKKTIEGAAGGFVFGPLVMV